MVRQPQALAASRPRTGTTPMQTTNRRMVAVAVIVCGFAVGMAGLLNYFKYRSAANRIVTERLVVTGRSVETVIHLALDLGLQFADIATLPETLERERGTDNLIQGMDIFPLSTLVASFALVGALRRLAHGVAHAEAALIATDDARAVELAARSPFGLALQRFILSTRSVGREIEKLNDCLERGTKP